MHISHCAVVHFSLFIVWLRLNFSAKLRPNSVSLENSSAFQNISNVKFLLKKACLSNLCQLHLKSNPLGAIRHNACR